MESVSRAFAETRDRAGRVIGVVPGTPPPAGYPNPWVEIPIFTHLPWSGDRGTEAMSRNHVNVLSSDAIVVLPGGHGTSSEARLAIDYGRPVVAFLESPSELPGLPVDVEVRATLSGVREFVDSRLAGR